MDKQKAQNENENNHLSERLAVPMETQVRVAKQKRKLAIARYQLNVRRGSAWVKNPVEEKELR